MRESNKNVIITNKIMDSKKFTGLFQETIQSIPLIPTSAYLNMSAHGIVYSIADKEQCQKYLAECRKHRVMPFTLLSLQYSKQNNGFFPTQSTGDTIAHLLNSKPYVMKRTIEDIINLGSYDSISIDIDYPGYEGFIEFQKDFSKRLAVVYQPDSINLIISYLDSAPEPGVGKYQGHSFINFQTHNDGIIKVSLTLPKNENQLSEKEKKELSTWFKNLKQEHHRPELLKE